ncbi:diaminopimelate decarboxylase [Clostridium cibarium]|uniref:Diaminopimelate decarboxylase n=1 Tax=Clostridium cibarium TaxID=2762247 RepID=A0ABR8PY08_9CLOT|nr:diaminopimelate decarboxylase [Clostridium cibarium]MBD7913051.1 diaminopimelate decarboxylase [Clostridium cibarium]
MKYCGVKDKDIIKAVEEYRTPLYIYDKAKIKEQYDYLKENIPRQFSIYYSMKANPLLGICEIYKSLGSGIEVASAGEIYVALEAGFKGKDILFTSPAKSEDELKFAIQNDVYCINAESIEELNIINELAVKHNKVVDIGLRINPDFDLNGASMKMTGIPTQFGIDQPLIKEAFKILKNLHNIKLVGIHVYTGSHILNVENIINNFEGIFKLANDLQIKYNFDMKVLDIGGGFGIPYFKSESSLDMITLKVKLQELWNRYVSSFRDTRIIIESGKFLMAESGDYVVSLLYKKHCKGINYLICNGGINHHEPVSILGKRNFPVDIIVRGNINREVQEEVYDIVGPLLTTRDLIGRKMKLLSPEVGDLLVLRNSGAYGLTHSTSAFLSHETPAEVIVDEGKIFLLRERGNYKDYINSQKHLCR